MVCPTTDKLKNVTHEPCDSVDLNVEDLQSYKDGGVCKECSLLSMVTKMF